MSNKLFIKRGLKANLPNLDTGELAFTTDEHKIYVGTGIGNKEVSDFYSSVYPNAGAHNSVYRGKDLGTSVTNEQYVEISAGTFNDLFIGDYWTINSTVYRIAAFDYYLGTGNVECTAHHVTLVPDIIMYAEKMNDTDTTDGAYVGSKMYTEGLDQAKQTIYTDFGDDNVLSYKQFLQNGAEGGIATSGVFVVSRVELMTEQNVYGGKIFSILNSTSSVSSNYTIDKNQYPLFSLRPDMVSNRQDFWLRDIVSPSAFAHVNGNGDGEAAVRLASSSSGVRPAFSIY